MSKSLSTITNAVIESYGNTALNLISAYRAGGERIIGFVDQRFESAVETGAARLSDELRANLIDGQKRISGYYARGLQFGTDRSESAVNTAVDLANKGVDRIAKQIREIAIENDIPIHENPPLAQALYKQVDVGETIPEEMYQAVAAILAKLAKFKSHRT